MKTLLHLPAMMMVIFLISPAGSHSNLHKVVGEPAFSTSGTLSPNKIVANPPWKWLGAW